MRPLWLAVAAVCACYAQQPPFHFEPNAGQAEPQVRFIARTPGAAVAFTDDEVRFPAGALRFAGANPRACWEAVGPLASTSSYFLGQDPSGWLHDIRHYSRLIRRNVYPGIDVTFYGNGERIEFDFILKPHADPAQIRISAAGLSLDSSGNLRAPGLVVHKPAAFQQIAGRRVEVEAAFRLDHGQARFELAAFDRQHSLTIDPTLEAWTFLGGGGTDRVTVVLGSLVAGVTDSTDLPVAHNLRGRHIFTWAGQTYTVYGGSGEEEPTAAAAAGNTLVLTGWTSSPDFPLIGSTSLQPRFGGGRRDGWFMVMQGSSVTSSSYLGGSGEDSVLAIAADPVNPGAFYLAGETTSADFPVASAVQPVPGGGKDGFVTHVVSGKIVSSTYWGGSGDDSILAMDATAASCWIGGRTNSPDLKLNSSLQDHLAGGSDGFLARLDGSGNSTIGFATYFGGSGDDEIRALHIGPDGWVWAAGVTTSADLPVANAWQSGLGGDMDGWAGRFHPGTGQPSFVTYIGGSGHDEIAAIAHDGNGQIYVAGWTASTDLKLVDPVQAQPGGGEDGLLARLDRYGVPQMLTYVGGAGNDRFNALYVSGDQKVQAAGESQSTSIPWLSSIPGGSATGGVNGLWLKFHQDGIYASDIVLGKDLTASLAIRVVGDAAPVIVRSTDPTLVTVNGGPWTPYTPVWLVGGAAQGTVDLILSAPPLAPRRVTVTLRPSYVVNPYTAEVSMAAGSQSALTFATATTHPDSGQLIYQAARADIDPGLSFEVDRPEIVQVRNGSNSSQSTLGASLRAIAPGSAAVSILCSRFPLIGAPAVRVNVSPTLAPAVALTDQVVGRGLQTPLQINTVSQGTPFASSFQVRFVSEDASSVLLSLNPSSLGAASVAISYSTSNYPKNQTVWVQGRADSGVARVRAEIDGAPPAYASVALRPAIVGFAPRVTDLTVNNSLLDLVPQSANVDPWSLNPPLSIEFTVQSPLPAGFAIGPQSAGPDPFYFSVSSSNTTVVPGGGPFSVAVGNPFVNYYPSYGAPIQAGTAQLSLSAPGFATGPPAQLTVNAKVLPLGPAETNVGKDLVTYLQFNTPYTFPKSNVTVTSSDPSRLLVGQNQLSGQASITISTNPGAYSGDGFYVTALGTGDITLTLAVAGYPTRSVPIHVVPIAFQLSPPALTTTLGDFARVYAGVTFPGAPAYGFYILRQGFSASFSLTASDASVLNFKTPTFTMAESTQPTAYPDVTAAAVGSTVLTLSSPSGAAIDPRSSSSAVTVLAKTFTMPEPVIALGKDLQRPLSSSSYPWVISPSRSTTFRSLDTSRLLLSRDPQLPGAEQLDDSGPIYLQALADSGESTLAASAPGFADASARVLFFPSALGFIDQLSTGAPTAAPVGSTVTLTIAALPVDPTSGNPLLPKLTLSLRAGLDPFNAQISTSDPTVGRVYSPVGFTAGMSRNTTQFRADASGVTELSVTAPGFVDGGSPLHRVIQVGAPKLSLADIALGKDLMYYHQVRGLGNQTASFTFTVTSSDPAKVLVSASPRTVGQASATVSGSATFYVQALDDNGDVTLAVTAPGYDPFSGKVHLEPSYVSFNQLFFRNSDAQPYMASFSKTVYLIHPSYTSATSTVSLRPGAGPVTVPVTSSDTSVVAVSGPVVIQDGYDSADVPLTAGGLGTAIVQAGAPPGFILGPDQDRTYTINVTPRSFNFGYGDVEKDRQSPLGTFGPLNYAADVTVVSADPKLFLLSTDPRAVGSGRVVFAADPKNSTTVYAQALGDTGSPGYTISAPGFQNYSGAVRLHPAGFVFQNLSSPVTLKSGATVSVQILTDDLKQLRPGAAPVTLRINNSNPSVATASAVVFQPGDTSQYITITAKAAGTAVFTILDSSGSSSYINLVVNVLAN